MGVWYSAHTDSTVENPPLFSFLYSEYRKESLYTHCKQVFRRTFIVLLFDSSDLSFLILEKRTKLSFLYIFKLYSD